MKRQTGQGGLSHLDPNVAIPTKNLNKKNEISIPVDKENPCAKRIKLVPSKNIHKEPTCKSSFHSLAPTTVTAPYLLADQWILSSDLHKDILEAELSVEHRSQLSARFREGLKINASHREIAIDWLIQIQTYLKAGNDVLHLAVTLMDLVLDREIIEENNLQLLAAASFWLAYKFYYGGIKAKCIHKWCDTVTQKEMVEYEKKILRTTNMSVLLTNSITVLNIRLIELFGQEIPTVEYHACNYLLELMLLNFEFAEESVSSRTLAAVYTALFLLKSKKMEFQENDNVSRCEILHERLLSILQTIRNSPTFRKKSALYRKYNSARYSWVSVSLDIYSNYQDSH